MSIQVIVTGIKRGYYKKFKTLHKLCFIFAMEEHTCAELKRSIS